MAKRTKLGSAPQYDSKNEPTFFTLKVVHGGKFEDGRIRKYIGGVVDYFDNVDIDMFGLIELHDFANQLGYDEKKLRYWHQFGINLHTGGRVLDFDKAVCGLINHLNKDREALVYFQHLEGENEGGNTVFGDNGPELDLSFLDEVNLSEPEYSNGEDSDDSDVLVDSEYDMDEDDRSYEKYIDPDIEFNPFQNTSDKMKNKFVSEEVYARLEGGNDEIANSSDEFESIQGSDEEDMPKYPKFNHKIEGIKPDLKIGLIFSSKKEAKETITTYCIKGGMHFKVMKNDKRRLQVVCQNEGCEWYVWVSPMQNDESWQIKAYNPEHTRCSWNYKNSSIKSGLVGKHFMKKFKNNPKLRGHEFRTEICTKLKANISKQQAYIARNKAMELIDGSTKEQFSRLRDYCHEALRTNPGSSVELKLIESDGEGSAPQFLRLYICFEACKEGFKACRKVIGMDGYFLKGQHGGQLLTAVGVDPNNNMFPIAYAVVESETRDAWEWFLTLLDNDIGFENQYAWTFMSDKQKGLILAFENLVPDADNRFCGVLGHNIRTCPKNTNATSASHSGMNPEPSVEPEEIPIGESQPFNVETTPASNEVLQDTQAKRHKLPVRRSSHASSKAQTDFTGSSSNHEIGHEMGNSRGSKKRKNHSGASGANVVQSSRVNSPLIVKGGVNYITMSNLGAYMGNSGSSKGTTSKGNGKSSGSGKGDMPKSG